MCLGLGKFVEWVSCSARTFSLRYVRVRVTETTTEIVHLVVAPLGLQGYCHILSAMHGDAFVP